MKFYFGLLMMLGGYCLFYWGAANVIHWPGVDSGQTTAPPLAMLFGFKSDAVVPHKIPFGVKVKSSSGGTSAPNPTPFGIPLPQIIPKSGATLSPNSPIPQGVNPQGNNLVPGQVA